MYISMFGCARYPSGQYVVGKKKDLIASGVNKMYRCGEKARAQPTIAGIYWILFILVCSFVMLSLFIGVITLAMQVIDDSLTSCIYLPACPACF